MENSQIVDVLKLLPVYFLFIATFGQASLEKLTSKGVPAWFTKQFEPTILNFFSGALPIQYYTIALLEAGVAILFLISGGMMEFMPGNSKTILKLALILALFTFMALGLGLRFSGDFQGAANLFMYFGVTFLIFIYVEKFAYHL